jgi:hypothetical protein
MKARREYPVVGMPDGRSEVEVDSKLDAALLNKVSRKSEEIRMQVLMLLSDARMFQELFDAGNAATVSGMQTRSNRLAELHRDLLQVLDIARTADVDPALVHLAGGKSNPEFRWGARE